MFLREFIWMTRRSTAVFNLWMPNFQEIVFWIDADYDNN